MSEKDLFYYKNNRIIKLFSQFFLFVYTQYLLFCFKQIIFIILCSNNNHNNKIITLFYFHIYQTDTNHNAIIKLLENININIKMYL